MKWKRGKENVLASVRTIEALTYIIVACNHAQVSCIICFSLNQHKALKKITRNEEPSKRKHCHWEYKKVCTLIWDKWISSWQAFIFNLKYRSTRPEVFCKKVVLGSFPKFTGKHPCQSLFFNKVACQAALLKKRLWRRCFPVNFTKFLRTPFLTEQLRWFLLKIKSNPSKFGKFIRKRLLVKRFLIHFILIFMLVPMLTGL